MNEKNLMSEMIQEDEIDLHEMIGVIIKRKKMILAVFVVSVFAAAIIGLLQPRVYKASVSLMILPSKMPTMVLDIQQAESGVGKEDAREKYAPVISLATHKELLKTNTVVQRIIDKLNLTDRSGKAISPDSLLKKLSIKEVKETNVLQLEAMDINPKITQDIVNVWAEQYINYSQEFLDGEIRGKGDFIDNQFNVAQKNFLSVEQKIRDFKNQYKLDLMRSELDAKKAKLNEYKKEQIDSEIILKVTADSLAELKQQISQQDKFIVVSKAITNDALWQKNEKDLSTLDKKLRDEKINPIYLDLEKRIVNTQVEFNILKSKVEYLKPAQAELEKEINELAKIINEKEFELAQLERQEKIYKRSYDALAMKSEEVRMVRTAQLGEVKIISSAYEPRVPMSRNTKKLVAITGMLSLMFGIFLAFVMEARAK